MQTSPTSDLQQSRYERTLWSNTGSKLLIGSVDSCNNHPFTSPAMGIFTHTRQHCPGSYLEFSVLCFDTEEGEWESNHQPSPWKVTTLPPEPLQSIAAASISTAAPTTSSKIFIRLNQSKHLTNWILSPSQNKIYCRNCQLSVVLANQFSQCLKVPL